MSLHNVEATIAVAQSRFADLLRRTLNSDGSINRDQYVRYLSMQYHLANDVQRYFITAAAHRDLARRRGLRRFLLSFANEEELHYVVAANDLREMDAALLPAPIDVLLWHAYFEKVIVTSPFLRLGAACILENLSGGVARPLVRQSLRASFLNERNTKFLVLHQHETVPHGEQVLAALEAARLDHCHLDDLEAGARRGAVMYLRLAEWALDQNAFSHLANGRGLRLNADEEGLIEAFQMSHLDEEAVA